MQQLADRPRATRYALEAEVVYRRVGEDEWQGGRTINVSRSGVLIHTAGRMLTASTTIEFVLLLPSLGLPGRSRVRCQGRVVRHLSAEDGRTCVMAATIDAYDFLGAAPEAAASEVVV